MIIKFVGPDQLTCKTSVVCPSHPSKDFCHRSCSSNITLQATSILSCFALCVETYNQSTAVHTAGYRQKRCSSSCRFSHHAARGSIHQSSVLSLTTLSHHTYVMNASAKDNTVCLSFSLVPGGLGKLQHEQKCCFVAEISHGIPLHQPTKQRCVIVQVWIGYNQSLRPCHSGLTLNMDITAAAFLEGQPMLQLIGSTVGMQNVSGSLNPGQARSIN
jgi:hypothetical protein